MNTPMKLFLVMPLVAGLTLSACAQPQPKAASSSEAIQQSQTLKTVEEKTKYLVSEANAFLNSQKFDEAIATAKHVLSQLDPNSADAKSIIEKAQVELQKLAEKKLEEMKGKLGSFGK